MAAEPSVADAGASTPSPPAGEGLRLRLCAGALVLWCAWRAGLWLFELPTLLAQDRAAFAAVRLQSDEERLDAYLEKGSAAWGGVREHVPPTAHLWIYNATMENTRHLFIANCVANLAFPTWVDKVPVLPTAEEMGAWDEETARSTFILELRPGDPFTLRSHFRKVSQGTGYRLWQGEVP